MMEHLHICYNTCGENRRQQNQYIVSMVKTMVQEKEVGFDKWVWIWQVSMVELVLFFFLVWLLWRTEYQVIKMLLAFERRVGVYKTSDIVVGSNVNEYSHGKYVFKWANKTRQISKNYQNNTVAIEFTCRMWKVKTKKKRKRK